MRRGLLLVLSLALIGASLFGLSGTTGAHPVSVDGSTNEWKNFGKGPSDDDVGHIARNAAGQGEYIWLDQSLDQRITATTTVTLTKEVDMKQVRVTGDADNLSFYVSLSGSTRIEPAQPGADMPQLQIAVDTTPGVGQTTFAAPATITPTVTAAWEYLLKTKFDLGILSLDRNSNSAPVQVYNNSLIGPTDAGNSVLQKIDNSIELQVPWSALGLSGPPSTPLRFTVVMLRSSGAFASPPDGNGSNILDTITPLAKSGTPTGVANTLAELSDNKIDYSFEMNFDQNPPASSGAAGEPYSPLLVTEVGLYPTATNTSTTGDSNIQWVEITNVSGSPMTGAQVSQYKIGDAIQRNSNEGMLVLPNKALNAGQSLIVTRDKVKFTAAYPPASFPSIISNDVYATTSLAPAPNWAATNFSLRATRLPTETLITDQVLLLNSTDTIADLVEYTVTSPLAGAYPDHTPVLVPSINGAQNVTLALNTGIQRCPGNRDTNNNDASSPDWIVTTVKTDQTPMAPCIVADVAVTQTGPQNVVVSVANAVEQNYTINVANNRLAAGGVVVTNTLPLGMSYKAGSTISTLAGVGEPTVSTVGGRTQLVWNVGSVPAESTGTITFTTSVPANTAAGSSTSDLSVSTTTREVPSDLPNNSFSMPVSYSTEPVVDVSVTQTILQTGSTASKLYPGGQVTYRIAYVNNGSKDASGVTLVDTPAQGLTYVSNSRGFAADTSVPGKVSLTVPGTLAANGGSGTVDVIFAINERLDAGVSIDPNTVSIASATGPELETTNNTSTSSTVTLGERPPAADLSVVKTVKDASKATPGGTIVYTLAYGNAGNRDAFGVTLTDSFPASLEYQGNSANLTPDQTTNGQVTFTLAPLSPGSSGSIDITFKVKAEVVAGTQVLNQATIATTSDEAPVGNNSSISAAVTITSNTPVDNTYYIYLPVVKK